MTYRSYDPDYELEAELQGEAAAWCRARGITSDEYYRAEDARDREMERLLNEDAS